MKTSAKLQATSEIFCTGQHVQTHKSPSWDQVPVIVTVQQTIQQGDKHAADLQRQKLCSLHQYTKHIHKHL
jgi:hypothetical protein